MQYRRNPISRTCWILCLVTYVLTLLTWFLRNILLVLKKVVLPVFSFLAVKIGLTSNSRQHRILCKIRFSETCKYPELTIHQHHYASSPPLISLQACFHVGKHTGLSSNQPTTEPQTSVRLSVSHST